MPRLQNNTDENVIYPLEKMENVQKMSLLKLNWEFLSEGSHFYYNSFNLSDLIWEFKRTFLKNILITLFI